MPTLNLKNQYYTLKLLYCEILVWDILYDNLVALELQ